MTDSGFVAGLHRVVRLAGAAQHGERIDLLREGDPDRLYPAAPVVADLRALVREAGELRAAAAAAGELDFFGERRTERAAELALDLRVMADAARAAAQIIEHEPPYPEAVDPLRELCGRLSVVRDRAERVGELAGLAEEAGPIARTTNQFQTPQPHRNCDGKNPTTDPRLDRTRTGGEVADPRLSAVLAAVAALEALAFNAERIAEHDANCGGIDAPCPPEFHFGPAERIEWKKRIAAANDQTRCELRARLLSTGGDRTLSEAREWSERMAAAVVGFGSVGLAKAAPEIAAAWSAFESALRLSKPGALIVLDAARIRKATEAARDAVRTMEAEAVAGKRWSTGAEAGRPEPKKLPELKPHDMQAWQLALTGYAQTRIAEMLNSEHGTSYKQPQVSRMIARARQHAEASGLQSVAESALAGPRATVSTMDPSTLDMGQRVERTGHAEREKERQQARDED